jgi:peptidyl-prolyl cis-trans isomerase C
MFGVSAVTLGLLWVLLILAGCGEKPRQDPIAARVGDQSITRSQLQYLYGLPVPVDSLDTPALEEAARDWVQKKILIQEAQRRGLDQDSLYLARMDNLRQELLVGLLYERTASLQDLDTTAVLEEYNSHHSEYLVSSDQIDLVYVLVPSRETANEVRQSLQDGVNLAQILAADETLTGQAVGWVGQGDLDPAIARAAFALVPGGVSYPQKRDDGRYVVLQARQRRLEGTVKAIGEVFLEVHNRLRLNKQAQAEKFLRDSLWTAYKPQIFVASGAKPQDQE